MNERYDVPDINRQLALNFRNIGHTMRHISEGKGSQKRILSILYETGSITQSDLTRRLGIQPGSASEVLGRLEQTGLIQRISSETDRRTTDIQLTDRGRIAAEEACRQRRERHKQMFSCISDEEKETLLVLLKKINASWDLQYRETPQECRWHS